MIESQPSERQTPQIRRATPEDVPAVVALHYLAFDVRSNQILLLGKRFMARAFRWYCQAPQALALVAEHRGLVVAYITASQKSYYSVYTANWAHALFALLGRPQIFADPRVWRRIISLLRRFAVVCRREGMHGAPLRRAARRRRASLAYLAVDPRLRLAGVAAALVRAAVNECQLRGWNEVTTSYHSNNIRARFLYASLGFKEAPELSMDDLTTVCWKANETLQEASGSAR